MAATKKAPKKTSKSAARKSATPAKKARAPSQADRKIRPGFISHTELVSADPTATKQWATATFGWKFDNSMQMPDGGMYHMWRFGDTQGGGIRSNQGPETPGTIAYVEVPDIKAAFAKALKGGAKEMLGPMSIPGSGGWMAIVQAPGGPAVGMWSNK